MAEPTDLSGTPSHDANRDGSPAGRLTAAPQAGTASEHPTPLNPKYGPEETVPGLECSYGSLAYSYASPPYEAAQPSRRAGCHTPVETP